ncbi:MAG: hypothetical protein ABF542_11305 [Gluconobacter sp.]
MLVPDAGNDAGFQSKTRRSDRNIGRTPPDRLAKTGHVFEPTAYLLSVKVHGRATNGDNIKICRHRRIHLHRV